MHRVTVVKGDETESLRKVRGFLFKSENPLSIVRLTPCCLCLNEKTRE